MTAALLEIPAVGSDFTDPDPGGVAHALARIGYRIEVALADLIDNSIDAGARNVLVQFVRDDEALLRVVIADDGRGMDGDTLRRAMQFGARLPHKGSDLGKYGMGLKTASFSQCSSLSVISRHEGQVAARRWTWEAIERGWMCDRLDLSAASKLLNAPWGDVKTRRGGTLIVWDRLEHRDGTRHGIDRMLATLFKQISIHLGLVFHRFLADRRLRIRLEVSNIATRESVPMEPIMSLDPFSYDRSGSESYPRQFSVQLEGLPALQLDAHIWPAKSKAVGYRLGGGNVAGRQGFYFYRNDRLIQAGGWNGCRESMEPHLSLARVKVDLGPDFDSEFRLTVQKSGVEAPPGFVRALDSARSGGVGLRDYMQTAIDIYRSGEATRIKKLPVVPGRGLEATARRHIARAIAPRRRDVRELSFVWENLDPSQVFEVDRDECRLILNQRYRRLVLQGAASTRADAPLVKSLLFLLLRDEFNRERSSEAERVWLKQVNEILLAAVRAQE